MWYSVVHWPYECHFRETLRKVNIRNLNKFSYGKTQF